MRPTTTRAGQVAVSTTEATAPAQVELGAAKKAVAAAGRSLPYPADVLECVAAEASADKTVYDALKSPGKGEKWVVVQEAAAVCVTRVRSGPRFAEDLQRSTGGKLSKEQVACAAREYGELTPEQIEAASGAVLNPEAAGPSALAPVEKIYKRCKIERGEG